MVVLHTARVLQQAGADGFGKLETAAHGTAVGHVETHIDRGVSHEPILESVDGCDVELGGWILATRAGTD